MTNDKIRLRLVSALMIAGISLGLCPGVPAQDQHTIDSLQRIINSSAHDTVKSDAFITLAGEYYNQSPVRAIQYCEQARDLARQANSDRGVMIALGWLAYLHEQTGDLAKAISYNDEALRIATQTGDQKKQAILLNNIAAIYKDRGLLDTAIVLNQRSLAIREALRDTTGMATTYNNLGLIYQGQGKIEDALDHFSTALRRYESTGDTEGMSASLQNIGAIYKEQHDYEAAIRYTLQSLAISLRNQDQYSAGYALNSLGSIHEAGGQPDSALYYYQEALRLRKAIDDQQGEAHTLKNIGNIHEKLHRDAAALAAYQSSLALFEKLDDKWGEAKVTMHYGALLLKQNNLPAAELYLQRSIRLARELGYPADISAAAYPLQQLYRQRGQYQQALALMDEYLIMHDSILNDNNRKAAFKTQSRYEYEKKEAALKNEQEKQNAVAAAELRRSRFVRNASVLGFGVVLVFATVFLLQRNRIAKEKRRNEALLLNILPREIAEELKEKGEAEARQFDSVTVLCTDFKDFTIRSENMTPKELVNELNMCFRAFDEIVTRHRLEKIKTVGDGYIAVAGLPVPNADHALHAVRAAIEIRDFMNKRWSATNEGTFRMRCGVHSGTVVAGIVGVKKYAYDIWGDTVNTATRMEQSCEAGQINLSGTTYELVKDHYACSYRGNLEAKNKGGIDMYYVN